MTRKLSEVIEPDLLKEFQIISTRVRDLDETKLRVLVIHDLPGDPECEHLKDDGWKKFHKIVFVSNWQMQQFVASYRLPWEACAVVQNAIEPIEDLQSDSSDAIRIIYHTTPHRGLELLVPVFEELHKTYPKTHLDVYSSFGLYGWAQRDEQFKTLFDRIKNHEGMTYHGYVPNEEVKKAVGQAHIFAYPSVWMETSCICLIEAMSAGCLCIHPNLGALYETAANWTKMYQFSTDREVHQRVFKAELESAIVAFRDYGGDRQHFAAQKSYTDLFYNWKLRKMQWNSLLESLLPMDRTIAKTGGPYFHYRT